MLLDRKIYKGEKIFCLLNFSKMFLYIVRGNTKKNSN